MPKTSAARKSMPHPAQGVGTSQKQPSSSANGFYQQSLFLNMALNMTWQLAVVVLVPIVGGYLLDQRYDTAPWLTVAGAVLAALGVGLVLRRVVAEANRRSSFGAPKGRA